MTYNMPNVKEIYKGDFQPSFGKYVGTMRELKDLAKSRNLEMMSPKEAKQEAEHQRAYIKKKNEDKVRSDAREMGNYIVSNFNDVRLSDGTIIPLR